MSKKEDLYIMAAQAEAAESAAIRLPLTDRHPMSISEEQPKSISIEQALHVMEQARKFHPHTEFRISVRKFNPGGLTAHQTTDAVSIHAGIDWEARQIIVVPAKPLTELTPEQVSEISESIRKGQSWHAYQREKKALEREKEFKARLSRAAELLNEAADMAGQSPLQDKIVEFLKEHP